MLPSLDLVQSGWQHTPSRQNREVDWGQILSVQLAKWQMSWLFLNNANGPAWHTGDCRLDAPNDQPQQGLRKTPISDHNSMSGPGWYRACSDASFCIMGFQPMLRYCRRLP